MKTKTLILKSGKKIRISKKVFDAIMERVNTMIPEGMIIVRKNGYDSPTIFVVKYGDITALY